MKPIAIILAMTLLLTSCAPLPRQDAQSNSGDKRIKTIEVAGRYRLIEVDDSMLCVVVDQGGISCDWQEHKE